MQYDDIYKQSVNEPERFWSEVAEDLHWSKPWKNTLSSGGGTIPRWFAGGELNACYNCVDRHVEAGFGHQQAIIYESPVTNCSRMLTFAQLQELTARLAGVMHCNGVVKGDRVLIYMPNSPEAIIAMLACARIGAIHSVVFGGFSAKELAIRIDDATPKMAIAASCGVEAKKVIPYQPILDEAFALATHKIDATIIWQRTESTADLDGDGFLDMYEEIRAADPVECVPVQATDPLYILYTSGTTGQPKGIVRDTGGYLVALAWSMRWIYNCPAGETFWAASDVGWVVGHSYMVYAPLLNRNTTLVYEGKPVGTPDAGIFWSILSRHRVRTFFTAPTAIRAIKQIDPSGEYVKGKSFENLSAVFLAGERTDPDTLEWTSNLLGKPVIDHWWQTETGWPICANPQGFDPIPIKAGSTSLPMPGWKIKCLDDAGNPVAANETGAIIASLPLPPGAAPTLWNAADRYHEAYLARFPECYLSGDAGYIDDDGYVFVMARIDDVINVAGHRLSSSAIEEVLSAHPAVAECAVVGVKDDLKGQLPVGFVTLKAGANVNDIAATLIADVRSDIGPVASFKRVYPVDQLPKTRSGKILRRTIRQIADGETLELPATIEDASVLEEYIRLFA